MFSDPPAADTGPILPGNSRNRPSGRFRFDRPPRLRFDDSALVQALDKVASCAAVTLGAPLGAISLVAADQVRFIGVHGFARRDTPRAGSFCDEVVRLGAKLLVADAAADPRFRDHELVATGGVLAYAGAPIRAADHVVIGAVGAFAGVADAFRPSSLDDLEALAHMVALLLARSGPPEIALPTLRQQGWIGVRTLDAHRAGTGARAGLTVLSVARGSPAAQAGLRLADVLYEIDGQILRERADLVGALANREPGSSARLTFQRAGQWLERHLAVRVAGRAARRPAF